MNIKNLGYYLIRATHKKKDRIFKRGIEIGMTRGIAWAIGFVNSEYYKDTIASSMARAAGIISKKELREADVDEYDLIQIGNVIPEE